MLPPGFSFSIGMGDGNHVRPTGHNQPQSDPPQPRESISIRTMRGGPHQATTYSSSLSSSSPHLTSSSIPGSVTSSGSGLSGTGRGTRTLRGSGTVLGGGGGGMAHRRGMEAFWASYNVCLAQRPLLTKCVTGK